MSGVACLVFEDYCCQLRSKWCAWEWRCGICVKVFIQVQISSSFFLMQISLLLLLSSPSN